MPFDFLHKMSGQVRVGRIQCHPNGTRTVSSFEGFTPIEVMTKSSSWGDLGPYVMKTEDGVVFENYWQSAKVYPKVPQVKQPYSRWNPQTIWEHPAEDHIDEHQEPTHRYWSWRRKLRANPYPVRYPAGFLNRRNALYSLEDEGGKPLTYVEARKGIYLKEYLKLVVKLPRFQGLKQRLVQGENLLVLEVDGPHQESLQHYKDQYGVDDQFIQQDTVLACQASLDLLLNDDKHSFGHGYCLAWALLDLHFQE